jgi:hypothetical protein
MRFSRGSGDEHLPLHKQFDVRRIASSGRERRTEMKRNK